FNFTFTGSNKSTFTFKDTHVADAGTGGNQTVTYSLTSADKTVSFTGTNSESESYSVRNGITTGTYKYENSYTYSNTGSATTTADDIKASFKVATTTGSYTESSTGVTLTQKETATPFSASYSGNGFTFSTAGTYTVDRAFDTSGVQTKGIVTTTFTTYSLAYKDPDTSNTLDNFTLSFTGTGSANEVDTGNGPTLSLALKNFSLDSSFAKITTTAATIDLSSVFDGRFDYNEFQYFLDDGSGDITGLADQLTSLLDGDGAQDSILDAANNVTLKAVSDGLGGSFGGEAFTGAGNDTITGSTSDDIIDGGAGNDSINAGTGDDLILGGLGSDTLTGGVGADNFHFDFLSDAPASSNADTVTDFKIAESDRLVILVEGLVTRADGVTLSPTLFESGSGRTAAQNSATRLVYDTASGNLFYDADGAGGTAAIRVVTLTGRPALTADQIEVLSF
ncbi:MAG: hypothetical protein EBS23_08865, partial [Betaproteobacteria bacterium]|nr:hypothetical protein [Betaproteobacteria bacterium]